MYKLKSFAISIMLVGSASSLHAYAAHTHIHIGKNAPELWADFDEAFYDSLTSQLNYYYDQQTRAFHYLGLCLPDLLDPETQSAIRTLVNCLWEYRDYIDENSPFYIKSHTHDLVAEEITFNGPPPNQNFEKLREMAEWTRDHFASDFVLFKAVVYGAYAHVAEDLYAHMVLQPSRFGHGLAIEAPEAKEKHLLYYPEMYYELFTPTQIPDWSFVKDIWEHEYRNKAGETFTEYVWRDWQDVVHPPVRVFALAAKETNYGTDKLTGERLEAYLHGFAVGLFMLSGWSGDYEDMGGMLAHTEWTFEDIGDFTFDVICDQIDLGFWGNFLVPIIRPLGHLLIDIGCDYVGLPSHPWPEFLEDPVKFEYIWDFVPPSQQIEITEGLRASLGYYNQYASVKKPNLRSTYQDELSQIVDLAGLYKESIETGPSYLDYEMHSDAIGSSFSAFNLSRKAGVLGGMYSVATDRDYCPQPAVIDMHFETDGNLQHTTMDMGTQDPGSPDRVTFHYDVVCLGEAELQIRGKTEAGAEVLLGSVDLPSPPCREVGSIAIDIINAYSVKDVRELSFSVLSKATDNSSFSEHMFGSDYRDVYSSHDFIYNNEAYQEWFNKSGTTVVPDPTRTAAENPLTQPETFWPYVVQLEEVTLMLPSDITADAISYNQIELRWKDNSRINTGYQIEYWPENQSHNSICIGHDTDNCPVSGLIPYTKYFFRVRAKDDAGLYSDWSNEAWDYAIPNWSNHENALAYSNGPKIATLSDGTLCTVFSTHSSLVPPMDSVWYVESGDRGATWSFKKSLGIGKQPSIAVSSSGRRWVVWRKWRDKNIYLTYSDDGIAWAPVISYEGYISAYVLTPSLTVDAYDYVHVTWKEASDLTQYPGTFIVYEHFHSTGVPSGVPERVYFSAGGDFDAELVSFPSVATDLSGLPYVAWEKAIPEGSPPNMTYTHRVCCTSKEGGSWPSPGPTWQISVSNNDSRHPLLRCGDAGEICAVWHDLTQQEICFSAYDGTDWILESIGEVSSTSIYARPIVAAKDGDVCVVWHDRDVSSNDLIYCNMRIADVWQSTPVLVSSASVRNYFPHVAISAGEPYANWTEEVPDLGVYEIRGEIIDVIPPEVTVIWPNGGERLERGKSYTMKVWAKDNVLVEKIEIYLSLDGTSYTELIGEIEPDMQEDEFSIPCVIPETIGGYPAISDQCKIKAIVTDPSGKSADDISDDFFSICWLTSHTAEASGYNNQRSVQIDWDRQVHVVWADTVFRSFPHDPERVPIVRYAQTETGVYWEIDEQTLDGHSPALALTTDGRACVAWVDKNAEKVCYNYRNPDGTWATGDSWESSSYTNVETPSIAIDANSEAHLVWRCNDDVPGKICYAHFPYDVPGDLAVDKVIAIEELNVSLHSPSVAVGQRYNNPFVVWEKDGHIWGKFHDGSDWRNAFPIASDGYYPSGNVSPVVERHGDFMTIVWERDGEIYHRRHAIVDKQDHEEILYPTDPVNISGSPYLASKYPQVAGGTDIVWQEWVLGEHWHWETYFSHFDGVSWSQPAFLHTVAPGASDYFPQVAVGNGIGMQTRYRKRYATFHYLCTSGNPDGRYEMKHDSYSRVLPSLLSGSLSEDTNFETHVHVVGDVVVDSGVTLTIEPGVTLFFSPDADDQMAGEDTARCEFIVKGQLKALGNDSTMVTFTSTDTLPQTGDWCGIRLESPAELVDSLVFCNIEYADIGIEIENGRLEIRDSEIKNNKIGIEASGGSISAKWNKIVDNDSVGVIAHVVEGIDFGAEGNHGNNRIYDNGVFDFQNLAADSMYVQWNYWGTWNEDSVTSTIEGPIVIAPIVTPCPPKLVSPLPGENVHGFSVLLDWVDVMGDTVLYTLQWDTDSTFAGEIEVPDIVASEYTFDSDTLEAVTIYWRVKATNAEADSCWSSMSSFDFDLPTTYWVDGVSGNDNNPGTREAPWATIQHAADVMGPWERVFVRAIPGTYDEQVVPATSGQPGNGIYYQSYPGDTNRAVVGDDNSNLFGFKLRKVSHIFVDGFEIRGQSIAAIDISSSEGVASSHNVVRNCNIVTGDVLNCVHIWGNTPCVGNTIENCSVNICSTSFYAVNLTNAPGTRILTTDMEGGTYGCRIDHDCDSVQIEGSSIRNTASYGIYAYSNNDGLRIADNTFHNAGENAAVYLSQNKGAIVTGNRVDSTQATATIWLDTKCYNSIVSDNVITMNLPNSGFGIRLRYDNDSVLVSGNTITGGKDHGSAGIYLDWKNSNVEITGNSVDSSMTKGAVIGGTGADNDDVWVTGNSISATDIGIHIEKRTQERTRIVNNFLHSSNHCVFNYGGETAYIAHNSIYTETGTGIFVDQNTGSTDDCTLRNNVVYSGSGYCLKLNLFFSPDGWDSDYNDLYTETGNVGRWGNTDTPTLSAWQSESDGDQHSISADPLFVSVSETNLHITEQSPCRNIATPISWITTDIDGELRDSLRDLGADEWYEQTGGGTMAGTIANIPVIFRLKQNRPNPFRQLTTIDYSIPRAAKVTLRIYDVTGRMVKELVNREQKAGMHTVTWKGKTPRSKTLATGVYFVRLCAEDKTATRKLVLVR